MNQYVQPQIQFLLLSAGNLLGLASAYAKAFRAFKTWTQH
jgi:hypothetical protein